MKITRTLNFGKGTIPFAKQTATSIRGGIAEYLALEYFTSKREYIEEYEEEPGMQIEVTITTKIIIK